MCNRAEDIADDGKSLEKVLGMWKFLFACHSILGQSSTIQHIQHIQHIHGYAAVKLIHMHILCASDQQAS